MLYLCSYKTKEYQFKINVLRRSLGTPQVFSDQGWKYIYPSNVLNLLRFPIFSNTEPPSTCQLAKIIHRLKLESHMCYGPTIVYYTGAINMYSFFLSIENAHQYNLYPRASHREMSISRTFLNYPKHQSSILPVKSCPIRTYINPWIRAEIPSSPDQPQSSSQKPSHSAERPVQH